jgi:hypothetical protein
MLPNVHNVDLYFDVAEHVALRTSLLIFLVVSLYRVVERVWKH